MKDSKTEELSKTDQGKKCRSGQDAVKELYSRMFHEIQFRATKNALMNYHEVERLQNKSRYVGYTTNFATAVSASGVFAAAVKKGKILSSRAGIAGTLGLPVCALVQLAENSSSTLVPSLSEKAKKHTVAAAGWMRIAETAKTSRLKLLVSPVFDLDKVSKEHEDLIREREKVASKVLIPTETYNYFNKDPSLIYLAIKKRQTTYSDFLKTEAELGQSADDVEQAKNLFF